MIRSDKKSEFKEVSYEEAIDAAARILAESKRPLMYGWASAFCEVHKKGILLAEELGRSLIIPLPYAMVRPRCGA